MNIILLVSDTFRYDNLFDRSEVMPVRTPELDRFGERAVSCENTWVSSFPTIPHRTDLTTGRVGWPWYPWQDRRRSSPNHLPQLLAQGGRGTVSQLLCDCPHLFKAAFPFGFTAAVQTRGQEGDVFFTRMNRPIEPAMPREKTRLTSKLGDHGLVDISKWINPFWHREIDRFAPRTALLANEWLEENYEYEPFLLWVDFFDPHEPWDPPEYMVRRYDPGYDGPPMLHPNYGRSSDYTEPELRNLRAHYAAEAELVDRWAGRVLQKIDDLGLWENSIVVFTSDHGFSIGEHERAGKSNISAGDDRYWPIYPEVAHVPLMIAAPGLEGGRSVDAIVQPQDIAPTLLELAGVEVEPPEPFHGVSFAPMLRGEEQPPIRDLAVSAHFLRADGGRVPECATTPMVYTERWAYAPIGAAGERELYDRSADRGCDANVAADHPDVCDELHARLLGWLDEVGAPEEAYAPFRPADVEVSGGEA
ncbi:MAG: sulfatase-like hydrolase/transferase [Planctomycetota bacterium]